MGHERRRYPRIAYPIEGRWKSKFGETSGRIGDISLGGCFVYARVLPETGDQTTIWMTVGEDELRFDATVVHVDPGMGFSAEFRDLTPEQWKHVQELLDAVSGAP